MMTRYSRQTVLPEIGPDGQQRLGQTRMLVVGAGGLGASALLYLAAAGVGRKTDGGCIGIIDDDCVDASNLQRQIIYTEADQGQSKAVAAAERLQALNHEIDLITYKERLVAENIQTIMSGYDLVIDGSDNFATKYLINDAAVKMGKPVVYGSIIGFDGQVAVFSATKGPCYRCLYPEQATSHIPNCAEAGTMGSVAGVIGSIQALEACKLALGEVHCLEHGLEPLIGKLLTLDARSWDIRILALSKSTTCKVCSQPPETIQLMSDPTIAICAEQPVTRISMSDLNDLYELGATIALIDVREAHEWATGHLTGAIHIPLGELLSAGDLSSRFAKDQLIVVYCQHGVRSLQAARYLIEKGFNTLNLQISV